VADSSNDTIRKITPAGDVTTIAGTAGISGTNDGNGNTALFKSPNNVAVDVNGNIYVADTGSGTVREIISVGTNYMISTLAGMPGVTGTNDGVGSAARFNLPKDLAVATNRDLYVADEGNNTIRKITFNGTNWVVSTLAGLGGVVGSANGTGSAARFSSPRGVAVDSATNVYVTDWNNFTIRKVSPGGVVTTLAGLAGNSGSADGIGNAARFHSPHGVAVDAANNVYVTDFYNSTLRKITPAGVVTTLLGTAGITGTADGTGAGAQLNQPCQVICDRSGTTFYIADTSSHTIRKAVYDNGQPLINVEPIGETVLVGGSFMLASAAVGAGQIGYQWTFNGAALAAATNSSITVSNAQFANAGDYGVLAGNGFGTSTNPVATVYVAALMVTSQPQSVAVSPGAPASFSVGIAGLGPITYQWFANAAALLNATNNLLVLTNVQATNAGYYRAMAGNVYGTVTSSAASLSVLGVPVSLGNGAGGPQYVNGQLSFQLSGLTGQGTVVIQASTNLVDWQPIFTNPPGFGAVPFTDFGASNFSIRYYRATTPPAP
jgi:hypothetical protein